MSARYDLVVVGAGSAGLAGAAFARTLGLRVALVESSRVGGDCTWTGCVPSKALLHEADTAGRTTAVDFAAVMRRVRAARDRVYALETPEELSRRGIEVLRGSASFRDSRTLEVGDRVLTATRFLLCTGAAPIVPPIPGLADGPYLTNRHVFDDLSALPERLVVLGGGPVGVELAQAFGRLGSNVTLVGRNARLLPEADEEASAILTSVFEAEGIVAHTGMAVERVERDGGATTVVAGPERVGCDALLVALGRAPNLAGLGLHRAGIDHTPAGIRVDERLRTSQPHVYAAGDAAGSALEPANQPRRAAKQFRFTHYAGWQAVMAVRNMFLPGASRAVLPSVPWAIFTNPEVAQVGLTEREARQSGVRHLIRRFPIARNDRAQTADERRGLMKFVLRPNGAILGATIVGTAAGELVNEVTLAMDNRIPFQKLCRTIHVYPSYAFALQLASADAFYERLSSGPTGTIVKVLARLAR